MLLPGNRYVSFDGLAVRVREGGLVLAGGTFAEGSGKLVSQPAMAGTLTGSVRQRTDRGLGWFVTTDRLPDDAALAGRTLTVRHGDGTCRSWTLDSVESHPEGTRLHVREETGFTIDPSDGTARYYQFPQDVLPGPHRFRISLRSPVEKALSESKGKNWKTSYQGIDKGNSIDIVNAVSRDGIR